MTPKLRRNSWPSLLDDAGRPVTVSGVDSKDSSERVPDVNEMVAP